jgi:hypothetical protein
MTAVVTEQIQVRTKFLTRKKDYERDAAGMVGDARLRHQLNSSQTLRTVPRHHAGFTNLRHSNLTNARRKTGR